MVNINVKKVLEKLLSTRMVIESGTDGIWTYRKWSDGTAECWGKYTATGTINNTWGSCFTGLATTLTYPQDLFKAAPLVQITSEGDSGYATWTYSQTKGSATQTPQFTFIRATTGGTGNITVTANIYAAGQWASVDPSSSTLDITGFSQRQMTKAEIRALIEGSGNIYKDNDTWIPSDLT